MFKPTTTRGKAKAKGAAPDKRRGGAQGRGQGPGLDLGQDRAVGRAPQVNRVRGQGRALRSVQAAAQGRTQAERANQTRARILDAAVREFSEKGLAGARTEEIAEAAGVNKALLYYYFKGKEALYAATLDTLAEGVRESSLAALEGAGTAGERFVRSALEHFDRIHANWRFQSLMQQEMVRLHRGEAHALSPLVERVFKPLTATAQAVVKEAMATGELIAVDDSQLRYSAMGANVFYFLSAPMTRLISGDDPLEWSALVKRRTLTVEYLGQTIFKDRKHGARVAARVLATTPMPENGGFRPQPAPEARAKRLKK